MNTQYAVKTNNLSKLYGTKAAVSHLNMEVKPGEIYGFIGRNGSGKSTTLKMCCGLVHPTEGEISLFGCPVTDETTRRRVGMLIEDPGLYPHMNARDNMILKAKCLGLTDFRSIDHILELMNLSDTGKKKTGQFSMGMKQRLGIAMALLGNPDLLILDEPINGLDPEGIREVRECLLTLNEEAGKTIIISSHILGELSKLATCYGIIKEGELIQQISRKKLEAKCRDYIQLKVDNTDRTAALLAENFPDLHFEAADRNQLHVYDFADPAPLTTLLVTNGIQVHSCSLHQMDLEQYFLELMEGGRRYA
ncbi:ABC transporter ATP-binding protein [Blautia schinkii]|nr:ABC transporter ATP-binding protein [Blautia schinkii]